MWVVREGLGRWEWQWRSLFVWEEELLNELTELLPSNGVIRGPVHSAPELQVFHIIWKSPAPSKVTTFS
ncbi:hypothetical protein A2U01_0048380, partial [Trifolium medium]|nr:hypothetical protein [Trifolium medium]